jgi:CheY-like chemotaxis protein
MLELTAYRVKTAANGAEALEKVRAEPPVAIFLDLMMPIMDGWEFLRQLRREQPFVRLPVVIMSAARDAGQAADQLGAQAFLPKPFDLEAVLALVGRLADGSHVEGGASV